MMLFAAPWSQPTGAPPFIIAHVPPSFPSASSDAPPRTLPALHRDEEQWLGQVASVLDVPRSMRERQGAMLGLDGLPPGMATDLIGMGNWRLRSERNGIS
jgi:hypothetical protein